MDKKVKLTDLVSYGEAPAFLGVAQATFKYHTHGRTNAQGVREGGTLKNLRVMIGGRPYWLRGDLVKWAAAHLRKPEMAGVQAAQERES